MACMHIVAPPPAHAGRPGAHPRVDASQAGVAEVRGRRGVAEVHGRAVAAQRSALPSVMEQKPVPGFHGGLGVQPQRSHP